MVKVADPRTVFLCGVFDVEARGAKRAQTNMNLKRDRVRCGAVKSPEGGSYIVAISRLSDAAAWLHNAAKPIERNSLGPTADTNRYPSSHVLSPA